MRSSVQAGVLLAALGHRATAQDFDWSSIQPSESLKYTPCYDTLKCAKLSVPLDWLNPTNNTARVSLAIAARPAAVPETDPSFGGTIIVNPGGPGAGGVQVILDAGARLQGITDAGDKHYEILSFDPRGVDYSEPGADCFRGDEFARSLFNQQLRAYGPIDMGPQLIARQLSLLGSFGKLCTAGPEILAYMTTPNVARDMLEIVDKIDELRKADNGTASMQHRQQDEPARIQYWGLSYGTALGNYFASMYPGRVGRMILEAVVDIDDYNTATWAKNLQDVDKLYDTLFTTCFEAGEACPLYAKGDASADDVRARVDGFLDGLEASPAEYAVGGHSDVVTREDIEKQIFHALYSPLPYFPMIAASLADGIAGNLTSLYAGLGVPPSADVFCPSTTPAPQGYTWENDAHFAVACGDAGGAPDNGSAESLSAYVDVLKAQSPDFGPSWTLTRLACNGWRVRPQGLRFDGPFGIPAASSSCRNGTSARPSAPVLFVSSLLDPVTPQANAFAMSNLFAGSAVLVQNSTGHATLLTPGACRDGHISRYLDTGALPPDGTVCQPDCKPFLDCPEYDQFSKRSSVAADSLGMPPSRGPLHYLG
ncbi:TAP-like protein-domain-containing protein [Hypoxylon sp. FL1284]|nr:TAP-like protein-domain-containing protein [Hypoxylon sp. FL1284]